MASDPLTSPPLKVVTVTIPIFRLVPAPRSNAVVANDTEEPADNVVIPVTIRLESVVPPVTESVPSFV